MSRFKKEIKTVIDFHLPESSSVINETSLEFNFKCQAGLWHVCCTKPNSVNIKNNPTNSSDVLDCSSLTGLLNKLKSGKGSLRIFTICDRHNECFFSELMPNDDSYQRELWIARVAMITSITIFFFWVTASKWRSYPGIISIIPEHSRLFKLFVSICNLMTRGGSAFDRHHEISKDRQHEISKTH